MVDIKEIVLFLENIVNVADISFLICKTDGKPIYFFPQSSISHLDLNSWTNSTSDEDKNLLAENVRYYVKGLTYIDHMNIKVKTYTEPINFDVYFIYTMQTSRGDLVLLAVKPTLTKVEQTGMQFMSMISHELRTPLTSIMGTLSVLKDNYSNIEKNKEYLDIAYRNGERLMHIVNDLLDFQSLETGRITFHISTVNLYNIAKQAIETNFSYAKRYKVNYILKGDEKVMVRCDALRAMQMLNNYLSNAAKFSPAGADVDVIVEKESVYGKVTVKDKGEGIEPAFQQYVFDRYAQSTSTVTSQKGGTGLGLYITRLFAEKQGGEVGFETKVGKGTSFYFRLPLAVI